MAPRAKLNNAEFRTGFCPNDPGYRQLWLLLSDVSERRRLASDDSVVGLRVDELEHEAAAIGRVEPKVAVALAVQRRGARGQAVQSSCYGLGLARGHFWRLTSQRQ